MRLMNELSHIGPRQCKPVKFKDQKQREAVCKNYQSLSKYGIGLDAVDVNNMMASVRSLGFDAALTAPLTNASITTPVQFLQAWLPGFVEVITAARRIDSLVGVTTQGSWEDEEIVQGVLEKTGNAAIYGDYTSSPLTSWNVNYERRTIVRFEEAMSVGRLEEARAAAIRTNSPDNKRAAAAVSLEIERNRVGFRGFNNGDNRTYGFLNSTFLPAYVNVPNGASGSSEWRTKTFLEIVADLRMAYQQLRSGSQERIDPAVDAVTLAVATDSVDYLTTVSDFGVSVREWISENYPKTRIVSAPELNAANGSADVFYLYAEEVMDSGSDDNRTWIQVVPNKFQTLGVDQRAKSYEEAYSNATAGLMLKRPYAVVRRSGI